MYEEIEMEEDCEMTRSTEQVFEDHKNAIVNADFPKLMADYADEAVLMTMDGAVVGKDAI